jgi:hypothetical protein
MKNRALLYLKCAYVLLVYDFKVIRAIKFFAKSVIEARKEI